MTPVLDCPTCRSDLKEVRPHALLVLADAVTGHIVAEQRMFRGACPNCGSRLTQHPHMGGHATSVEAHMKERYTKPMRRKLKANLAPHEYRRFKAALEGNVFPELSDHQLWQRAGQG